MMVSCFRINDRVISANSVSLEGVDYATAVQVITSQIMCGRCKKFSICKSMEDTKLFCKPISRKLFDNDNKIVEIILTENYY